MALIGRIRAGDRVLGLSHVVPAVSGSWVGVEWLGGRLAQGPLR